MTVEFLNHSRPFRYLAPGRCAVFSAIMEMQHTPHGEPQERPIFGFKMSFSKVLTDNNICQNTPGLRGGQ